MHVNACLRSQTAVKNRGYHSQYIINFKFIHSKLAPPRKVRNLIAPTFGNFFCPKTNKQGVATLSWIAGCRKKRLSSSVHRRLSLERPLRNESAWMSHAGSTFSFQSQTWFVPVLRSFRGSFW